MRTPNVLITGVGGFIGTHFLDYFLRQTDYKITGIDSFKHKGTYYRLQEVYSVNNRYYDSSRVKIYQHDLTVPIDSQLNHKLDYVDYIINLASNSAVERSVLHPIECFKNNCDIICTMLEFARYHQPKIFFQMSTDEVYGDFDEEALDKYGADGFPEWSPILPSNPYAASKAAQEDLCIAYWRTHALPLVLINTMNNIGEWQDTEKFLPKIISRLHKDEEIEIYTDDEGNLGSRVYLDVQNHASAIHHLINSRVSMYGDASGSKRPDRYNVCGSEELNNFELADLISKIMHKDLKHQLVPAKSARPGYDKRYLLNGCKLDETGWKPPHSLTESLHRIVRYTVAHPEWMC